MEAKTPKDDKGSGPSRDEEEPAFQIVRVVTPFTYLRPTTMVVIIELKGTVDLPRLFWFLPVTRVTVSGIKATTKNFDMPYMVTPGVTNSIRFDHAVRGLVRSSKSTTMKNAIAMDVQTACKPVCAKLTSSCIHICGAYSDKTNYEAARYIIEMVRWVQKMIDRLKVNKNLTYRTIVWVVKATRGVNNQTTQPTECDLSKVVVTRADCIAAGFREELITQIMKSTEIDPVIAMFLLRSSLDHHIHSEYIAFLAYTLNIDRVHSPDFDLNMTPAGYTTGNINYSIDLNIGPINRIATALIFQGTSFRVIYDNATHHSVKLELVCKHKVTGDKKEVKVTLYKSGKIMMSTKTKEVSEVAYNLMMDVIMANLKYVQGVDYNPKKKPRVKIITADDRDPWFCKKCNYM